MVDLVPASFLHMWEELGIIIFIVGVIGLALVLVVLAFMANGPLAAAAVLFFEMIIGGLVIVSDD